MIHCNSISSFFPTFIDLNIILAWLTRADIAHALRMDEICLIAQHECNMGSEATAITLKWNFLNEKVGTHI